MRPMSVPTSCGRVSRTTPDEAYCTSPASEADSMVLKLYKTESRSRLVHVASYIDRARSARVKQRGSFTLLRSDGPRNGATHRKLRAVDSALTAEP